MSWILVRGGHLFAPEDRGIQDLLMINGRIVAIGANLPELHELYPLEIVDAQDQIVLPGLIDPHLHIIGASGLGGPTTRTTDLQISCIAGVGITTVISPLGADSLSRTLPDLLARAMQMEAEGITAYCYTGGWRIPVPSLMGDPLSDVTYLDRVLGIKVAIAEPKAPYLSVEELSLLAHAAIIGGKLSGKKAVLHAHVGDRAEGLHPLEEAVARTGLPIHQFVATHVNRNPNLWEQAIEYAKSGGSIDITTMQKPEAGYPKAIHASRTILDALEKGVPISRITMSSDGGAGYPRLGPNGEEMGFYMAGPESILETVRELVQAGLSWGQAVSFATVNTADLLGLAKKGRLEVGSDADILILTKSGNVDRVYCRGKLMVKDRKPVVQGLFED
jgi:beta-aspartyl-dipeptidase (metallo-type)